MAAPTIQFRLEGQEHRVQRLMISDAETIQAYTGKTLDEFMEAATRGDARCFRAMVWLARKQDEPGLVIENVDADILSFEPINDEAEAEDGQGNPSAGNDPATPPTAP